jgi:methyl-accepting chemotaxis protein
LLVGGLVIVSVLLQGFGLLVFARRRLLKPLGDMTEIMTGLAGGDHSIAVPFRGRPDEIGEMARSVQTFKEVAIYKLRLEEEAEAAQRAIEAERAERAAALAAQVLRTDRAFDALVKGLKNLTTREFNCKVDTFTTQPAAPLRTKNLCVNFNVLDANAQTREKMVFPNVICSRAAASGAKNTH